MPLDDIQSLMDETAEAKEYQVSGNAVAHELVQLCHDSLAYASQAHPLHAIYTCAGAHAHCYEHERCCHKVYHW